MKFPYHCYNDYLIRDDNTLMITLFSVGVTYILGICWDVWKRQRDLNEELKRVYRTLLQETKINLWTLTSNISIIEQDNNAANMEPSNEVIIPLDILSLTAGEIAFLKGSLETKDPGFSMEIRNLYAGLNSINHKIEKRELYRLTNGAMSNYTTRRKKINEDIIESMLDYKEKLKLFEEKILKIKL